MKRLKNIIIKVKPPEILALIRGRDVFLHLHDKSGNTKYIIKLEQIPLEDINVSNQQNDRSADGK